MILHAAHRHQIASRLVRMATRASTSLGNRGRLREVGRGESTEALLPVLTLSLLFSSFFGTAATSARVSLNVGAAMLERLGLSIDVLGSLDFWPGAPPELSMLDLRVVIIGLSRLRGRYKSESPCSRRGLIFRRPGVTLPSMKPDEVEDVDGRDL